MYTVRLLQEGGTQGGISWLVWVVLIVFLLMVFLGWLVASKGWLKKDEEPKHNEHGHEEPALVETKSVLANNSAADDLTELEGIGPKVAKVLAGIDISSFESLAKADYDKVKTALDAAGYKYMDPAGWIEQAALAANGDTEGLKKLQDSLKGGRKAA